MKKLRMIMKVFRMTGADKVLFGFLLYFFAAAAGIWMFEPTINTYRDSVWYCFVVVTTIGFGDISATAFLPRLLTILLSVYSIFSLAILTAVITSYYTERMKLSAKESTLEFLDKLEHLPELSKEELTELSERVKKFKR